MGTISKSRELTAEEINAFGAELDALRKEVMASLGKKEADYIYGVRNFVRYSEIASRSALMFLGWLPPVWLGATALLGVSKIVENMELGHNVMHGQYDWMNDASLRGNSYEWDTVCTADNWRHTHNYMHHTYTNVREVDHDIGYGVLRIFGEQKWEPRFLANPIMATMLAVTFEWTLALQSLELEKVISGEKTWAEVRQQFKPIAAKMRKQFTKDYIFFPLIAGPMFLPVLAGNFVANLIRNFWTFAIIFCGHFTEDAETFDKSVLENETRGQWYLRQLRGSSNLKGGKIFNLLTGNLSHQIEHHMFPDVPGVRYADMAVKVQEIAARYGQHYNTGSFTKQFSTVVGRIFKYALPFKVKAEAKPMAVPSATVVPLATPKMNEGIAA
ncbi:fatty acid desaturase family protein [Agitococcus lubricus]|uniref:Linoleoyl-CoA desaturase n=1 Tax=Agitococcus lubricus TaxID=1077255 RepID=A0A2T5IY36_9GAMM|nr:acyl-CoA desaturase [Agitococcus lubricus]PTQ88878.1 linoleoyl-CoA desaturase [Agitococcus lubricus]